MRSDPSSKNDLSRSFLSPLKLISYYGPKSPLDTKTRPGSPGLSASVLTLCSQQEEELPVDSIMSEKLFEKFSTDADRLMKYDSNYIDELPGITENEANMLKAWRDRLMEQKREESILHLLDDYQDRCFKKV